MLPKVTRFGDIPSCCWDRPPGLEFAVHDKPVREGSPRVGTEQGDHGGGQQCRRNRGASGGDQCGLVLGPIHPL